ncbi:hypothetical protein [Phreatobacter sp. AB_2022a]|uniref:hypothetical protein n=1 Tax=Phreatobacter sp. AB_2022a TaxID=3003134 RepID=UPI0022876CDE|nr:hypothetical protein [Phreatobacter sp. AB_2022a]MCZ0735936.1 hypothetical protein [Phreatobacter sp. AB_2022a]
MMKVLWIRAAALALLLAGTAIVASGPAAAQPAAPGFRPHMPGFRAGEAACRRALPLARRHVGQPARLARARFRAPAAIQVRYCMMCTHDYRPNRLTFGLDERNIVRSVSCG